MRSESCECEASAKRISQEKNVARVCASLCELANSHYFKFKNKNITFIFVTFVNVTDCCSKISANVTSTLIAVSSCALFLSFGTLNSFQMDADGFFLEDVAIVHR